MAPAMSSAWHVSIILLALVLPESALAARLHAYSTQHNMLAAESGDAPECSRAVAVPGEKSLQEYFDGLRRGYGILSNESAFLGEGGLVDPGTCTKKDVCLLMRQLDMDFYQRARSGLLQDIDYKVPPTKSWVKSGTCKTMSRGFKMAPVTNEAACREAAKAKNAVFEAVVRDASMPTGCVVRSTGQVKAYVNLDTSNTAVAGVTYANGRRRAIEVLCEMDRSLSESAAAYYSPYKLKPSMVGREAHSTSCSFGMYAFLAKLRETMSPCARILTYKAHSKIGSAQAALALAAQLERQSRTADALKLRNYVESIRQKYVLIDVITRNWCPGIWTGSEALAGATCSAPRVMSWTAEGQEMQAAEAAKAAKAAKASAAATGLSASPRAGGKPSGGRLASAMAAHGGPWETTGNQDLLDDLDKLLASLSTEDQAATTLLDSKNEDATDPSHLDSRGKPIKIALTEQACSALSHESLADVLEGRPEAPPDFFAKAALEER